ncbi:hypothetical protein [Texcoconibacillus texcoconensis]|uniref:Uncharacterized protein n=1 Tax=Texcoconibacillus texcoconensis TaxID=1095777 RepID=A0A840QP21_9BACI|nr:hypothetical protein [Texcoconibacillus texcoconensis]MBB5173125.1 hypothetical protein [Texcoconibacillus texcoconensis]
MDERQKRILGGLIFIISSLLIWIQWDKTEETLMYFPEDERVSFLQAFTSLSIVDDFDEDQYTIGWNIASKVDEEVYLRQDVSLLFEDGRLIGKENEWEGDASELSVHRTIDSDDSGRYEAISFHHAEIHYPYDEIKSKQTMSSDQLYVVDSPLRNMISFHEPTNEEEQEAKDTLDKIVNQQLEYTWKDLIHHFDISLTDYDPVAFNKILKFQNEPIPKLTMAQTKTIIGQLWEGLYRNYILAIRDDNNQEFADIPQVNKQHDKAPIGHSMPLILIHKDRTHLFVVYENADGDRYKLRQNINLDN